MAWVAFSHVADQERFAFWYFSICLRDLNSANISVSLAVSHHMFEADTVHGLIIELFCQMEHWNFMKSRCSRGKSPRYVVEESFLPETSSLFDNFFLSFKQFFNIFVILKYIRFSFLKIQINTFIRNSQTEMLDLQKYRTWPHPVRGSLAIIKI